MTKETIILFGFKDISAVRVRCNSCTATILYPLQEHRNRLPDACNDCGNQFQAHKKGVENHSSDLQVLIRYMIKIMELDDPPFTLLFEMKDSG